MILFLDQSGQPGGAELCLADVAHHFRDRGRVLLLSEGPFADTLRERGVPVDLHPLPGPLARLTRGASPATLAASLPALARDGLGLRRRLRPAGLLYFNTAKALLFGTAAAAGLRKPTLFHLHDLLEETHFSPLNLRLLVAAANRADAVIANSQATAEAFVARGGRAPVYVIPNGFDPAWADALPACEVEALRRELNPEGRPVVALFGRLARWKGQEVLVKAAERLPEAVFWIVGDALFTGDDHAYAEALRQRVEELERARPGRIRLLGFRRDVAALMRAADVVVHASIAPEPFGRVLVEAMLARRPVVATRGGGPGEIVEEGASGLLVPPGDDAALAEALRQLLGSPALREAMGARGRERAEALYSLPPVLARTAELLDALLHRRKLPPPLQTRA